VETESTARRIEAEADIRLQQSLYSELRRVLCNYRRGILTLYGVVSSFHVRQIAQELVQGLEGIEVIDNQLVVAGKTASPISGTGPRYDGATSDGATSDGATSDGVISAGAGSTGSQESVLRKIPAESQPGPASSDAQA